MHPVLIKIEKRFYIIYICICMYTRLYELKNNPNVFLFIKNA